MSRIGRQIIIIPEKVTVIVKSDSVTVTGPKGELTLKLLDGVKVSVEEQVVKVTAAASNLHGLFRSLIANNIKGVSDGWTKVLELSGTGYRAATNSTDLNLSLGFSHPVVVKAPAGISFAVEENKITVAGIDKTLVGDVSAKIRGLRPADVYKAKGFKYAGEVIRRKPGKAAKAGATTGGTATAK